MWIYDKPLYDEFLQTVGNDQAVTYELQQAGAADAW